MLYLNGCYEPCCDKCWAGKPTARSSYEPSFKNFFLSLSLEKNFFSSSLSYLPYTHQYTIFFFFFFLPHSFTRQQNKREKSIYTKNFLYVRINGKLARIESNRNPSCSPLKLKRFNVSPLFSSSCRVVEESSER